MKMERLLTPKEVRDILRIGRTTMYKMIRNSEIPVRKIGRKWGIPESSLNKWLRSGDGVVGVQNFEPLHKVCWEIKKCSYKERSKCAVYKLQKGVI